MTVDRERTGLIREDLEDKINKLWIGEMGRLKGEFRYTPRFLAHGSWADDGAVLGEREPGLVKKRLSFLGLVHDGTWWRKCPTCLRTRSGEMTELRW